MYEAITTSFKREADGAYIRRKIKLLCLQIGFSSHSVDSILLMVTEILTNVTKHGNNFAQVQARPIRKYGRIEGLEVEIKDNGPGIDNIDQALIDGYSTAGSLGLGLGAVIRLSDNYLIETFPESKFKESGTQIKFEKYLKSRPYYQRQRVPRTMLAQTLYSKRWNIDGYTEKREGSRYNGDGIFWKEDERFIYAALIDGVGHGYSAYLATQMAIGEIKNMINGPLDLTMTKVHETISDTVGCQIALLRLDKQDRIAQYLIVGNIRGFVLSPSSIKSLLSKDGTVGRLLPSLQIQELNLDSISTMVFHSDGISRVWVSQIKNSRHSMDVSLGGDILRKHRKSRDDSSYILVRNG